MFISCFIDIHISFRLLFSFFFFLFSFFVLMFYILFPPTTTTTFSPNAFINIHRKSCEQTNSMIWAKVFFFLYEYCSFFFHFFFLMEKLMHCSLFVSTNSEIEATEYVLIRCIYTYIHTYIHTRILIIEERK